MTYAPGMGSYHQLVGVLAEVPSAGAPGRAGPGPAAPGPAGPGPAAPGPAGPGPVTSSGAPACLPECAKCRLCFELCPTGAITEERFLLRAERCLTFLNEDEAPWPDWLDRGAHNSLVGCLACQEKCPANKGLLRVDALPASFSREETEVILAGPAQAGEAAWEAVSAKVAEAGLGDEVALLSRNLRALVEARGRA